MTAAMPLAGARRASALTDSRMLIRCSRLQAGSGIAFLAPGYEPNRLARNEIRGLGLPRAPLSCQAVRRDRKECETAYISLTWTRYRLASRSRISVSNC